MESSTQVVLGMRTFWAGRTILFWPGKSQTNQNELITLKAMSGTL